MDPSKLTAYRDAAKAAREFRPLPDVVYTDMLSDAVIKLVAEVERLQAIAAKQIERDENQAFMDRVALEVLREKQRESR